MNTYSLTLPSSESDIKDYPKKLNIIPLNVKAFKYYTSINQKNATKFLKVFKQILQTVIQDKIDVGQLTFPDVMEILMWLRINSAIPGNSDEFTYDLTCKNCDNTFERKVKLSTIDSVKLKGYKEPQLYKLKSNGEEILLKIPRLDDEIAMLDLQDKDPDFFKENQLILRSAFSIVGSDRLENKLKFLEDLTDVSDLGYIIDFINKNSEFGFSFKDKEVECPKCKNKSTTVLPFRGDLIVPLFQVDGLYK